MEGRVACFGGTDSRNSPGCEMRENGRRYYWALPGEVLHWKDKGGEPARTYSKLPYGLLVFDDFRIVMDDPMQRHVTFVERFSAGHERAKDMARMWPQYGAVDFSGKESPTAEQERVAQDRRRKFGELQLHRSITSVEQNRRGKTGKPSFDPSDDAWAIELGRHLPKTFESLPKQERAEEDRMPCPECADLINPQAKLCKHCHSKLPDGWAGKTVAEAAQELIAMEDKTDSEEVQDEKTETVYTGGPDPAVSAPNS